MEFEMIREPFILQETVEILYRFVNGISCRPMMNPKRLADANSESSVYLQIVEQLQDILEQTCQGLDREDPGLQRFFRKGGALSGEDDVCLARFMTRSFASLTCHGFEQEVQELHEAWHRFLESDAWISGYYSYDVATFCFSTDAGCPGDLFKQIRALELPGDFRMELYDALRDFDQSLDELADLMRPAALRLEQVIHQADWILDHVNDYWSQMPISPLDWFLGQMAPQDVSRMAEKTKIVVMLIRCHLVAPHLPEPVAFWDGQERCNRFYLGCSISAKSEPRDADSEMEFVSTTLRVISDRRRLEILRKLSAENFYGMELAESIGINQGNLSRSLALLHNCGFIRQKRNSKRTYYQADYMAFHNFLQQVERVVFGKHQKT